MSENGILTGAEIEAIASQQGSCFRTQDFARRIEAAVLSKHPDATTALDAERYRALKARHGFLIVARLLGDRGYSSAHKDARIDAYADAAVADVRGWAALSETERAAVIDAERRDAQEAAADEGLR